jgi:hypothetical protein
VGVATPLRASSRGPAELHRTRGDDSEEQNEGQPGGPERGALPGVVEHCPLDDHGDVLGGDQQPPRTASLRLGVGDMGNVEEGGPASCREVIGRLTPVLVCLLFGIVGGLVRNQSGLATQDPSKAMVPTSCSMREFGSSDFSPIHCSSSAAFSRSSELWSSRSADRPPLELGALDLRARHP